MSDLAERSKVNLDILLRIYSHCLISLNIFSENND